jgi:antitoxin CptB
MDKLAKLRWQCRRGSRELDFLLNNYLETRYPVANEAEKARFVEMLKLEDCDLLKRGNDLIVHFDVSTLTRTHG